METAGIYVQSVPVHRVHYYFRDPGDYVECTRQLAPPIPFQRIKPPVGADGVLINMVSGVDIALDTLDEIRMAVRGRDVPLHLDFHSLTTAVNERFERTRRPVEAWRRWAFMMDTLQFNEDEIAGLAPEAMSEEQTVGHLLTLGVHGVVVTRGARGVTVYRSEHKKVIRAEISGGTAQTTAARVGAGMCSVRLSTSLPQDRGCDHAHQLLRTRRSWRRHSCARGGNRHDRTERILVVGSNGLLGQKVAEQLVRGSAARITLASMERPPCATCSPPSTSGWTSPAERRARAGGGPNPDVIINCAAMTNVDACETERDMAWKINVGGVEHLVEAARRKGAMIVHVSSDYVFDGKSGPYTEDDRPEPLSYYGKSKLASENVLRTSGLPHFIARTMVLYGIAPGVKANFALWLIKSLEPARRCGLSTTRSGIRRWSTILRSGCSGRWNWGKTVSIISPAATS